MSKIVIYRPFDVNTESTKLIAYLRQAQEIIISTSYGPYSKLKLVAQSQNSNFKLTSSSKYLIKSIYKSFPSEQVASNDREYIKWLFDLILHTIELHIDSSFDLGLSTVYLLNEFYILHATETSYQRLIETSFNELYRHLRETEECSVKLKLDLSNLKHFKVLFQTIFNTKPVYRLLKSTSDDHRFLNLVLQANLSSFCADGDVTQTKCFTQINYLFNTTDFQSNLNDSRLFNGVLISADNLNNLGMIENALKSKRQRRLKCVLFDTQLSADFEQFDFENVFYELDLSGAGERQNALLFVDRLKSICDILLSAGVDVVLCQKVIHPSIKSYLLEKGCVPIDRISITYTSIIVELTGCKICKSAFNVEQLKDDASIFGHLTSLGIKRECANIYFHFENDAKLIQTMIVCLPDDVYVEEIQHLLKVAQSCFQRAILSGYLLCGGPCFYSYIICYLWKYVHQSATPKPVLYAFMTKLKSSFISLLKNLLENNSLDYHINTSTGHIHHSEKHNCECGVFSDNGNNKLELFDEQNIHLLNANTFLSQAKMPTNTIPQFLDCYESRLNSIRLVKTLLTTIFQIGVFINDV